MKGYEEDPLFKIKKTQIDALKEQQKNLRMTNRTQSCLQEKEQKSWRQKQMLSWWLK